jgi:hypothetical protein
VIHKSYAQTALSVIANNSYTDVALYVLDANATIDVRHTLLSRPKVLLSDLSGYGSTVVNPLQAVGTFTPLPPSPHNALAHIDDVIIKRPQGGHALHAGRGVGCVVGHLLAQLYDLLLVLCRTALRLHQYQRSGLFQRRPELRAKWWQLLRPVRLYFPPPSSTSPSAVDILHHISHKEL